MLQKGKSEFTIVEKAMANQLTIFRKNACYFINNNEQAIRRSIIAHLPEMMTVSFEKA